jgi:hypothetical protein
LALDVLAGGWVQRATLARHESSVLEAIRIRRERSLDADEASDLETGRIVLGELDGVRA